MRLVFAKWSPSRTIGRTRMWFRSHGWRLAALLRRIVRVTVRAAAIGRVVGELVQTCPFVCAPDGRYRRGTTGRRQRIRRAIGDQPRAVSRADEPLTINDPVRCGLTSFKIWGRAGLPVAKAAVSARWMQPIARLRFFVRHVSSLRCLIRETTAAVPGSGPSRL